MGIDNEKLAAAIVALYTVTSKGGFWTDTDELIQQHAFQLWQKMSWDGTTMAVHLWRNGWPIEQACSFADIDERAFWAELRRLNVVGEVL